MDLNVVIDKTNPILYISEILFRINELKNKKTRERLFCKTKLLVEFLDFTETNYYKFINF